MNINIKKETNKTAMSDVRGIWEAYLSIYEQAPVAPAPAPKPVAKPVAKAKPQVTDPSSGVDIDDKGRWQGQVIDQGKELEPEKTDVISGKKGPDPNLPSGEANPNKKKDYEVAGLSAQERSELLMLRKGLINGDYGTGPQIDKQIRSIDMKLYGMPIIRKA